MHSICLASGNLFFYILLDFKILVFQQCLWMMRITWRFCFFLFFYFLNIMDALIYLNDVFMYCLKLCLLMDTTRRRCRRFGYNIVMFSNTSEVKHAISIKTYCILKWFCSSSLCILSLRWQNFTIPFTKKLTYSSQKFHNNLTNLFQ